MTTKFLYFLIILVVISSCSDKQNTSPQVINKLEKAEFTGKIDGKEFMFVSNDSNTMDINAEIMNTLEGGTDGAPVVYFYSNFYPDIKTSNSEFYRILSSNYNKTVDWRTLSNEAKFKQLQEDFAVGNGNWLFTLMNEKYNSNHITKLISSKVIEIPANYNRSTFNKGILATFSIKGYCNKYGDGRQDSVYVDATLKTRVLVNDIWHTSIQVATPKN